MASAWIVWAPPVHAQDRLVQRHAADEPEGRLIAFYAAVMVFTPLGAVHADASRVSRWSVGIEGAYVPRLSEAQRRPGIDKPETTNLSPVLPRPRVVWRAPAGALLEGSWIPPIRVGEAKANLVSAALSRSVATWGGVTWAPRLSVVAGRVRGAITCNAATARDGGPPLATYYRHVCHGNDSDDWFEPRIAAGELVASRHLAVVRGTVYVAVGARVDRSRFDIGVIDDGGSRDADHPILQLRDTRGHLVAGGRWSPLGALRIAGEWFYVPGSVSTIRALAGWQW